MISGFVIFRDINFGCVPQSVFLSYCSKAASS